MRVRIWALVAVCGLFWGAMAKGQEPKAGGEPQGSISGHVYLSDTNGPARFARILLKPIPNADSVAEAKKKTEEMMKSFQGSDAGKMSDDEKATRMAGMAKLMSSLGDLNLSGVVAADGSYTLTGVKPGTYYLHATVAGYVDPFSAIPSTDIESADAAVQKRVQDAVTTVTVNGSEAVHQDLRLQRGAAVSGHVTFDDGSPAAGWTMSVIPVRKAADGAAPGLADIDAEMPDFTAAMALQFHVTDDRGAYRFAGLAAGEYVVRAVLNTQNASAGGGLMSGGTLKLTVWSGNVMQRKEATTLTLTAGEELGDENLVMPLSKMHSISGKVLAKADAQPVNAGIVVLREDGAGAGSIFRSQSATVQDDGTFRFDYIANGHYTLKISNASIEKGNGKTTNVFGMDTPDSDTVRSFANAEQKVDVADDDVSGVTFSLADEPVEKKVKTGKGK